MSLACKHGRHALAVQGGNGATPDRLQCCSRNSINYWCARWLVDTRRRAGTDLDGAQWMFFTFFPAVQLCFVCPVYMAFLVAPPLMRNQLPNAPLPIVEDFGNIHGQRFTCEHQAVEWLLQF